VFTKDTLTGKNRFGDDLSRMSYTLDTTKKPIVMKLTVTKNFPRAKADAIVQIRNGKLYICYYPGTCIRAAEGTVVDDGAGKAAFSSLQYDEILLIILQTRIFDPNGYSTPVSATA